MVFKKFGEMVCPDLGPLIITSAIAVDQIVVKDSSRTHSTKHPSRVKEFQYELSLLRQPHIINFCSTRQNGYFLPTSML